jgi:uncharacterized protein YcgI (DUF1989 family)
VDAGGRFRFADNHAQPGDFVELRFEMDTLVLVSTAPHPLDPRPDYAPGKVAIVAWDSGPAAMDDLCRLSCPENGRGYTNTDMIYR